MSSFFYKHERIDLATDAIRLLRLKAGSGNGAVCCELFQAFLDPDCMVPYEALSYVWGDTSNLLDIYISGGRHQVTLNLYRALLALRQPDQDRILWIDAICIDQKHVRERGHQVQRMKLIYQYAENVVIWLGPGIRETDMVLDWMARFDETVLARPDYRKNSRGSWEAAFLDVERQIDPGLRRFDEGYQRALRKHLLDHPWFRRVWILQEAASAKSASVQCGARSVPSRTFAMVPLLSGMEVPSHVNAVLDIMPGARSTAWRSREHKLEALLRQFGDMEATDPRDKVYALVGISADAPGRIVADYNVTAQEVFRDAAIFIFFPHKLGAEADFIWSALNGRDTEIGKLTANLLQVDLILFDCAMKHNFTMLALALLSGARNSEKLIMVGAGSANATLKAVPLRTQPCPLSGAPIFMTGPAADPSSYTGPLLEYIASAPVPETIVRKILRHITTHRNSIQQGLSEPTRTLISTFFELYQDPSWTDPDTRPRWIVRQLQSRSAIGSRLSDTGEARPNPWPGKWMALELASAAGRLEHLLAFLEILDRHPAATEQAQEDEEQAWEKEHAARERAWMDAERAWEEERREWPWVTPSKRRKKNPAKKLRKKNPGKKRREKNLVEIVSRLINKPWLHGQPPAYLGIYNSFTNAICLAAARGHDQAIRALLGSRLYQRLPRAATRCLCLPTALLNPVANGHADVADLLLEHVDAPSEPVVGIWWMKAQKRYMSVEEVFRNGWSTFQGEYPRPYLTEIWGRLVLRHSRHVTKMLPGSPQGPRSPA